MKITTKGIGALFIVLIVPAILSCGKLDVVGTGSVQSFEKILRQIPQGLAPDTL